MEISINLTLSTQDNNYIGRLVPTHGHKFLNPETGEVIRGNLVFEADSPFEVFKNLIGFSNIIKEIEVNNENS